MWISGKKLASLLFELFYFFLQFVPRKTCYFRKTVKTEKLPFSQKFFGRCYFIFFKGGFAASGARYLSIHTRPQKDIAIILAAGYAELVIRKLSHSNVIKQCFYNFRPCHSERTAERERLCIQQDACFYIIIFCQKVFLALVAALPIYIACPSGSVAF